MREIQNVIDNNEKILWEGAPQMKPYVIPSFMGVFGGLLLLLWFSPFIIGGFLASQQGNVTGEVGTGHIGGAILLGLFVLAVMLSPLWSYLSWRVSWYAITEKRVIIQSGIIGRDFQFIDHDQVLNATVSVGITDKILGNNSGSITAVTKQIDMETTKEGTTMRNRTYTLSHITDPYTAFKFFKNAQYTTKADVQYPRQPARPNSSS